MENIDELKTNICGKPRYRLRNGNLFVSAGGFHFLDYLDPTADISPEVDPSQLTAEEKSYIEKALQSNGERFNHQIDIVKKYLPVCRSRFLDVGCGGGLFLSKIKQLGGIAVGAELSDSRAHYAQTVHDLEVHKRPIESALWPQHYKQFFDAVTLWDVIEHVNYPRSTLSSAAGFLKAGGLIFIDTPCRDSFYHRFGELTYKISNGAFPTFLNTLYSSHRFGHKQIFSTTEMRALLEDCGFEVIALSKFHELSFPYRYYLKKMLKSELLATAVLPLVKLFLLLFPVRNKMLVIARKKGPEEHDGRARPVQNNGAIRFNRTGTPGCDARPDRGRRNSGRTPPDAERVQWSRRARTTAGARRVPPPHSRP